MTGECLDDIRRVLREEAVVIFNVTDRAPFDWAKRLAAGLTQRWPRLLIGMEPVVSKGKRFGNLLLVASDAAADVRRAGRAGPRPSATARSRPRRGRRASAGRAVALSGCPFLRNPQKSLPTVA